MTPLYALQVYFRVVGTTKAGDTYSKIEYYIAQVSRILKAFSLINPGVLQTRRR